MTKTILIATVAALAIAAPAQAQPGGNRDSERAEKAEARKAQAQQARSSEPQVRAERPQRQEPVRMERPQRQEPVRIERPQRQERVRMELPQREQRIRVERPRERLVEQRAPRIEQRVRRPERAVERRAVERRSPTIERVRPQASERLVRQQRVRQEQPRTERAARTRDRVIERRPVIERQARAIEPDQPILRQDRQSERLARQELRQQQRIERQQTQSARVDARQERRVEGNLASVGERLNVAQVNRDWYDDYAATRHRTFYDASPDYFYDYDYDDGYLYQVDRDSYLVTALFPLLGGAFSVGQPLPYGYDGYNVPYAYRSLYYDTPEYSYRYGDSAIYRIDPTTQLISAVVALLTGQNFGVGQMLPMGYDAYNVPYAYRDTYYDTYDAWYRYEDGFIYQVDPYSRMIVGVVPVSYGGYAVGYPVPAYASYGGYGAYAGYPSYAMPYGYQNLYNGAPGYNYHYANGGIYQVDPTTQLISALVALVTGTNLGVGQMLPTGYDVYNVPDAYRSSYFDSDDAWYRYDDGYIYEVDPYSRMIEAAIPVSYGGYAVGYPVPAAYPGYAVPDPYQDLYYAAPGYDYRYFDGGIYQVDPDTQMVRALAALVTGQTLGVGSRLPMGYDVYNVPDAYRDRYYDNDRYMYRYADGSIYQVDPSTRLISAVIDAVA